MLVVPAAMLFMTAGVTADAFITFRVVDNFVHGDGLRWNIAERVQVYTHPLWMLLHIPFYALWEHIFWINAGLSILCALGAALLTIYTFRKPWPQTLGFFLVPMAASAAITKASMLGLENPLTHLLFASFGFALLRPAHRNFWFWISFAFALEPAQPARYVRVLCAGHVVSGCSRRVRSVRWGQCLLGSLPILGWEAFSLFYYGFPFPNTAYAKLTGFNGDNFAQGIHYLLNLMATDMTSAEFMDGGSYCCRLLPAGFIHPPDH